MREREHDREKRREVWREEGEKNKGKKEREEQEREREICYPCILAAYHDDVYTSKNSTVH